MGLLQTFIVSLEFLKSGAFFLNRNRDLLFFPILSLLSTLGFLALTVFASILSFPLIDHLQNMGILLGIITVGIILFVLSFITLYFNASLIACATLRLQGKNASLGDGLELAAKRSWCLVKWSLVNASVGLIIRALENSHSTVEEIVGAVIGVSWTLATYFVVPVLLFENVGPFQALKRGFSIFGRGWKRTVAIHLIFTAVAMIFYGILVLMVYLMPYDIKLFIELAIALFIFHILIINTVGSAFNGVVNSALYLSLLKSKAPIGFDKDLLSTAFRQRGRLQS